MQKERNGNVLREEQEMRLQRADICMDIIKNSRNELYLSMRFLDVPLSSLEIMEEEGMHPMGTDGRCLFFQTEELITAYGRGRIFINRMYLHIVFHCLFGHVFYRKGREAAYWNLACDITAEYILDGLCQTCIHLPKSSLRRQWYRTIENELSVVTAEGVYRLLTRGSLSMPRMEQLAGEFRLDDHQHWQQESRKPKEQQMQQRWDDIRDKMQTEMETFSKEASEDSEALLEQVQVENRERYDYREFLRKFSVLKEELKVDTDSFDYIFYNYGMETYGNMPLIEPLETKEVQQVEEFVIVVDTSMSCKGALVRHFLEETYDVLSESESFCRKIHVRILQCDDQIQDDHMITKDQELKEYMERFEIKGQGGTDFRPAFAYVEGLIQRREFTNLRGLLYFTDGYGIFPIRKPPYETAFIFMKDDYRDVDVPPWAIKLIIDPDERKRETGYEY